MAIWTYNQQTEINLMKIVYEEYIKDQFNKACPLFGLIKVNNKPFKGLQVELAVQLSVGGGRSAGAYGTPGKSSTGKVILTTKKLYTRVEVDSESMKASKTSIEAFASFTKEPIDRGNDGMNLNIERQMIRNDLTGAGILLTANVAAGAVTVSGSGYKVIVAANTNVLASVEVGDLIQAEAAAGSTPESTKLLVVDKEETAAGVKSITVEGTSAALAAAVATPAAVKFYMENSKGNELQGLRGLLLATPGVGVTYKNIPISYRWSATQHDASNAAVSVSMLNKVVMKIKERSGKAPKSIHMPYNLYTNYLTITETLKRYNVDPRSSSLKGKFSFSALEFEGPEGTIPVFCNQFINPTEIYILNQDHITFRARGPAEWEDVNGQVFRMREESDVYVARLAIYADFFANPHFQGIITNISPALIA